MYGSLAHLSDLIIYSIPGASESRPETLKTVGTCIYIFPAAHPFQDIRTTSQFYCATSYAENIRFNINVDVDLTYEKEAQ